MPKLSQYLHYHLPKHPHLPHQYDFPEVSKILLKCLMLIINLNLQEIQFANTELEDDVSVVLQIILVLRKLKHSLGVAKKHQAKGI